MVTGRAGAPGKVVWVFPGQGSQWAGMGRELLDTSPVFAERVAECAAALSDHVDWSLIDVLRGEAGPELLERVDVRAAGQLRDDGGAGRRVAVVRAGARTPWSATPRARSPPPASRAHCPLRTPSRVVALRSRAIATRLAGRGGMASVALSEDDATALLAPWADRVQVAAVNSPTSVVVAGEAQALAEALDAAGGPGSPGAAGGRGLRLAHQPGRGHPGPAGRDARRDRARRRRRCRSTRRSPASGSPTPASWTAATGTGTCATRCGSARPWPTCSARGTRCSWS